MKILRSRTAIIGIALLLGHGLAANAAEIKVITGLGMSAVWKELGPKFERASGHELEIWYGVGGSIRERIDAGEAFDLAVFGKAGLDAYIKKGTIAADTRTEIARAGLGVGTRAGAPKPDISSVDAFKRALLDAKSVTYHPRAANGLHMAKVYERLGIAEQMKGKNKWPQLSAKGLDSFQAVRDGEAELVLVYTSQLLSVEGVQFVGPFPPELQNFNVYVAGVAIASKQPEAAQALIRFLRSPAAVAVIKAKGMESAPASIAMSSLARTSQTGNWPDKPVRIVVAAGPGTSDDFVARLIASKLGGLLGQQFIVLNRPGAGGMIGQTFVLNSPPDGYTLLLAGGSMAGARYVNANISYDVLRDFMPISLLETSQFVMVVHPTVPVRNLKEYIALARSHPGMMTYGIIGAGQIPYWSAVLFNSMARIRAVEVTYKTGTATMIDVMAGRVDYFFASSVSALANKTKLRALAVTGTKRSHILPEVPTIAEAALPGYEMPAWRSIMGPAGMRRDIVDSLNAAIARTLSMTDIRDRMRNAGFDPAPSTPEALTRRFADWVERFGKIAKQAQLKPQ